MADSSGDSKEEDGHVEFIQRGRQMNDEEYNRLLKPSLNMIIATMFLSSMGFTIIIPSLWLFFSHFEECRCPVKPPSNHSVIPNGTNRTTNVTNGSAILLTGTHQGFAMVHDSRMPMFASRPGPSQQDGPSSSSAACHDSMAKKLSLAGLGETHDCKARKSCNAFTGLIVSAFPLAQLVSSPIFGYMASRTGVRPVVSVTLAIMAVGYLIYALARDRWVLFISRLIMGVGAGNVSVLRFYASGATSEAYRTVVMAKMSGAQSLGFVLGPGIGYGLALLMGTSAVNVFGREALRVDAYTAPGFFAAAACIVNALLVRRLVIELREPTTTPRGRESVEGCELPTSAVGEGVVSVGASSWRDAVDSTGGRAGREGAGGTRELLLGDASPAQDGATGARGISVFGGGARHFVAAAHHHDARVVSSSAERGGAGEADGGWGRRGQWDHRAFCIIISIFGTIVFVFSIYEGVGTQISECALGWEVEENGLFLCAMGCVAVASMLLLRKIEKIMGDRLLLISAYCTLLLSLLCFLDVSPPLHVAQWVTGGILLSASFPVAQAMVYVVFSRSVPRRKQGVMMGYLTSMGSLARMLGPPFATMVYSSSGFRTWPIFAAASAGMLLALGMVIAWWDTLEHPDEAGRANGGKGEEGDEEERGGLLDVEEEMEEGEEGGTLPRAASCGSGFRQGGHVRLNAGVGLAGGGLTGGDERHLGLIGSIGAIDPQSL